LATSETISDWVEDDEALVLVDDEDVVDETLDDEFDDCNAVNRLVRSVSSVDSRLAALVELSLELEDELESLELDTLGGGPGGGPPAPLGPLGPPLEAPLAELWLLSDEPLLSCDRKAKIAADSPTAVEASEVETVLLADVEVDALAVDVSDELFWLAKLA
jgi:hypothetical protein